MRLIVSALFIGCLALGTFSPACTLPGARDDATAQRNGAGKKESKDKKHRGTFTIGKETTYISSPVDKDGYIDYSADLNERLRQGVTPANNANILLLKALGPHHYGHTLPAEFFQFMEMEAPPVAGEYFIEPAQFMKEHLKVDPDEGEKELALVLKGPWTANDYPDMAAWLKANEKPLGLIVEATKRSQYYSPLVAKMSKGGSDLLAVRLGGAQKCRSCANALIARATFRMAQGASDAAWQDLLACHRLGRLVGRGATIIEALIAFAVEQSACSADLVFLHRARPTAQQVESCLRDLQRLPPLPAMADKVDLGERYTLLNAIMLVDRYGIQYMESLSDGNLNRPNPLGNSLLEDIDWDPALRSTNQLLDRIAAAMRKKDRSARQNSLKQIEAELEALKHKAVDPNTGLKDFILGDNQARGRATGNMLIGLMIPGATKVQLAADQTQQIDDNVQVAFALAWYERDHGRYPKGLAELAPKYLNQVPQDSFSGKALIYRPAAKGYLLYSVGINGRDDEGRGRDDTPAGDDLSVRMPLPEVRRK
ncbi:MAG TPA: hypothetical protein VK395_22480 [Gemmataceae bacterium]|nr:hypothetical protein [Gemmataceae bacterium]